MYAGFCSVVWLEYFFSHKAVSRRRVIIGAVVGPILFSGLIEVAQGYLTSYRGMDFYDLIFNTRCRFCTLLCKVFSAAVGGGV